MKKLLIFLLALTMILPTGVSFAIEGENQETLINYADKDTYSNVKLYRTSTAGTESIISPSVEAAKRPAATAAGQVTTNSTYSNATSSTTHNANNSWYAIDLGESRKISTSSIIQTMQLLQQKLLQ